MSASRFGWYAHSPSSAKFAPLIGALIGALGGAAFWVAALVWPSSVAVILSMALTASLIWRSPSSLPPTRLELAGGLFCLLIKYNALMALSAAKLPFVAPANAALALIMVCAHAASFALMVSVSSVRPINEAARIGAGSLLLALLLGLAPAALLGIPGLTGLAAAILGSLGLIAYLKFKGVSAGDGELAMAQLLAETGFYLGALATWSYV